MAVVSASGSPRGGGGGGGPFRGGRGGFAGHYGRNVSVIPVSSHGVSSFMQNVYNCASPSLRSLI